MSRCSVPGLDFVGTTVDANVLVRKLREADGLVFGNPIVEVRFDDAHKSGRSSLPTAVRSAARLHARTR